MDSRFQPDHLLIIAGYLGIHLLGLVVVVLIVLRVVRGRHSCPTPKESPPVEPGQIDH